MDELIFGDIEELNIADAAVVNIPENLEGSTELFEVVKQQLGLPRYFGKNWDAFSECLRDLSWVPQRTVALVHSGRTFKDDRLWKVYLDVLKECIQDWREGEEHRIVAVFPDKCRDEVAILEA